MTRPAGPRQPARGRAAWSVIAVIAVHDVLAVRLPGSGVRAAARLAAAAAALGIARAAGVPWGRLGLGRRELGGGARLGAASGGCAAAAVLAGALLPATRAMFGDRRGAAARRGNDLAAQLARIIVVAVPAEEITYRSALIGVLLGDGSPASAAGWSSALFGLSHVLPTLATMDQTALRGQLAGRAVRRAAFVGGNVAVTGLAGATLAWLRLRSGSVVAPLLAHGALNGAALVAARTAHGRDPAADGR